MNGVCIATVTNTVAAYVQSGLEGVLSLKRSENSHNTRRVLDGKAEALIIALVCGPAPEGHCRWTFRLLEGKSRLQLETPVSRETIRRALKKRTSTSPQGLLVYPGNSHFQKSDRLGAKHIPCHVPLLHLK
jgi:hypothetical protein